MSHKFGVPGRDVVPERLVYQRDAVLERRSMERLYMGVGIGGELVPERLVYQRDVVSERRCARETFHGTSLHGWALGEGHAYCRM